MCSQDKGRFCTHENVPGMRISYGQKQQTHETRRPLNQTEKKFVLRRSDSNLCTHKYIFSTYLTVCVGAHKAFQKGQTEWGEGVTRSIDIKFHTVPP